MTVSSLCFDSFSTEGLVNKGRVDHTLDGFIHFASKSNRHSTQNTGRYYIIETEQVTRGYDIIASTKTRDFHLKITFFNLLI